MNLNRISGIIITLLLILCGCGTEGSKSIESQRIVFLGDSITALGVGPNGYVSLIESGIKYFYPNSDIQIFGAGISGNKVTDCIERLKKDVIDLNPTIVVIYIGINDVSTTTVEDFSNDLLNIVNQIIDKGSHIILCTLSVIGEKFDSSNQWDSKIEILSDEIRKISIENGCDLVDLRKEFIGYLKIYNQNNKEYGILTWDTVHLNDNGNKLVYNLLFPSIISIIGYF